MRLPPDLHQAIQREIEKADRTQLSRAVAHLTQSYKTGDFSAPAIRTQPHRAAYLAVRVPATFAANLRVFREIHRLAPEAPVTSLLDLGAGPGTSMYAAAEVFPSLRYATMVEADGPFIELGRAISQESSHAAICGSRWFQADLQAGLSLEPHDLVVISYTLNELSPTVAQKTVLRAWACVQQALAVIEPGTMRGFGFVHAARDQLIALGAHIFAPCPHAAACPMAAAGDWCHFAQRVERTSTHRSLKAGALGHEDEKFSYVVAGRNLSGAAAARIVRHPQKHTGHVQLLLCTPQGLQRQTVSKSQKEIYRLARKAEWGDEWIG
jgi:ribosomal protein RSM22 (predicted rRNA methylase)